jgi:predicted transcriptional regulator
MCFSGSHLRVTFRLKVSISIELPKLLFQDTDTYSAGRVKGMKQERYAFVLIAGEKYWDRLCERNKAKGIHAFVRKSKVAPKNAQKLLFYVKKPVMQVRGGGVADFIERLTGDSGELWRKYGAESCFESYEEYCAFAKGRSMMTFVRFKNFKELENPKPTQDIRSILGSLQGFRGKYVSLATAKQLII